MELAVDVELSVRDRAILRAVEQGRGELVWGSEPDLFLDGRYCCDQSAVHRLVRAGLIAPARAALVGERVSAVVTTAGRLELVA
jgi:hypothetical protein